MESINITKARQDLFNIVESVITTYKPIQILSKKGGVVMISLEDFESIQETLYLNSVKGFKEDLDEIDKDSIENWCNEDDLKW